MKISVDGEELALELEAVIVAGYTGRDRAAVQHHIEELSAIGVPPPATFPAYWIFPPYLARQDSSVTVVGQRTSGEAELCLIVAGDEMFVTIASDHTDREAEAVDIGLSKAACAKPIAREAWRVASVGDRWDELELRSWIIEDGAEIRYQEGTCASLVPAIDLLAGIPFSAPSCFALLTGTVPVIGSIRPSPSFRAQLVDSSAGRSIELAYDVTVLDPSITR